MARQGRRHFPQLQAAEPAISEWVGNGMQDGWKLHYKEVLLDGKSLSVGDCALIAPNRVGQKPFVCQIIGLYEDQNEERFAAVRWFYRAEEMHHTLRRLRGRKLVSTMNIDRLCLNEREIYAGHEDTLRIETIEGKCCVKVGDYDSSAVEGCNEEDVFSVNHFFDDRTGALLPLVVTVYNCDGNMKRSETQAVGLAGHFRLCAAEGVKEIVTPVSSVRAIGKYKLRPSVTKPESIADEDHSLSTVYTQTQKTGGKRCKIEESEVEWLLDELDVSDDDSMVKTVKPRGLSGLRKQSCMTSLSKCKNLKLLSPVSFPGRSFPCTMPSNVFEEARVKLQLSSLPESLPCREDEFMDICSFVESRIEDGCGGCLYISGVPGSGKTATVHEVISNLQQAVDANKLEGFQFVEVNGMKVTEACQIYPVILKQLTGERATAHHAQELLSKLFSQPSPQRRSVVLMVDELDLLWTKKQDVMYNLFNWPTLRHSHLIVLAIANTMDLPERVMTNRVQSRLGVTRLTFQPYTFKQLQEIVLSRLQDIKAFDPDAIQLAARKVAAVSGDARRALDICCRAAELAQSHQSGDAKKQIGMHDVDDALKEMFSSAKIVAIHNAPLQEKLFLRCLLSVFSKSGIEEATLSDIWRQHSSLCRLQGFTVPSVGQLSSICDSLGSCRLLVVEPSRLGMQRRIRLNLNHDDLVFGLKDSSI